MKQKFLCLLLIPAMLAMLAACGAAPGGEDEESPPPATDDGGGTVYTGKIVRKQEDSVLISGQADQALYWLPLEGLSLTDAQGQISADQLAAGMLVEIRCEGDGLVLETYPIQFAAPLALHVTGREEDMAGFYLMVMRDLYGRDSGLSGGIELIALDLTQASNLSEGDKAALCYLVQDEFGVMTTQSTFDALVEAGDIKGENGGYFFETGLLTSITDVEEKGAESFTFSIQNWRSSLAAY
ncbi:MAG: hypothetical protein GX585_04880, partial [Clostridiales bacterium]|nr:hypothetical protein [Clostridiales bacterium]